MERIKKEIEKVGVENVAGLLGITNKNLIIKGQSKILWDLL